LFCGRELDNTMRYVQQNYAARRKRSPHGREKSCTSGATFIILKFCSQCCWTNS